MTREYLKKATLTSKSDASDTKKIVRGILDEIEAGGDEELAAQVVAVGCDEPTSVRARRTPEGAVVLEAAQVPSPGRQCFAPMTTVAVVVLEAGGLSAG